MQSRKSVRWLRYLIIGAVLAALAAMALWPTALKVDAAAVDRGVVRETLEAEGRTKVRERYVVTAPMAATLRRLTLQPGDAVKAGEAVALLDAQAATALDARSRAEASARVAAAQAQQQSSEAEARSAQAAVHLARAELGRQQALARDGMVSAQALLQAETLAQRAELEQRAAAARLQTARHQLEAARAALIAGTPSGQGSPVLTLRAPVDGVVLRRHGESARPVQPGEPLLELGDPADLEVEVDVLSADAARLQPGLPVELLRWGPGAALRGVVRRIEPGAFTKTSALGVEEQRVWVLIDITSPRSEWERLGEAYRVNARFVLRSGEEGPRVPASALFAHGDGGQAVFRIDGGKARLVPVKTGVAGEGRVQITEGLAAGERVVIHPPRELADGARVATP